MDHERLGSISQSGQDAFNVMMAAGGVAQLTTHTVDYASSGRTSIAAPVEESPVKKDRAPSSSLR
jgi:hypothetical protein